MTFRLATPVQGSEADGAKIAMSLLRERREQCPGAVPVLFVHDEIVLQAPEEQAEQAADWLRNALLEGMQAILDPVPVTVDVTIGPSWGEQYSIEEWRKRSPAPPAAPPSTGEKPGTDSPPPAGAPAPRRLSPPLKWHGGKFYLAKRIVELMPAHTHYIEPYAGGLSVLLARKNFNGVSEVVNDLNGDLTNFWTVIQAPETFERFRRMVEAVPFSEVEWERARTGLGVGSDDPVQAAVCFFILCRQSLAGRMQEFSSLTRTRTRRGMNDQASAWLSAVAGLPAVHERLKRVVIRNRPALEVIGQEDGPQTLIYADPPYLASTRTSPDVYRHELSSEADHRELLEVLKGCRGKVMLSGYPSELYARVLADWNRHEFDVPNRAAHGPKKRRMIEVVWCNF